MGIFDNLLDIATDVAKIAIAPVEIITEVVKAPLDEVANVADELVKDVKDATK